MIALKGIYRTTIDSIRRTYLDFLSFGAKIILLNEEYNRQLAEKMNKVKLVAYDTETPGEAKYILLNTALDEVSLLTQTHFAQVDELKAMENKLHLDIQTFIERCAADHPSVEKESLMNSVLDMIKNITENA